MGHGYLAYWRTFSDNNLEVYLGYTDGVKGLYLEVVWARICTCNHSRRHSGVSDRDLKVSFRERDANYQPVRDRRLVTEPHTWSTAGRRQATGDRNIPVMPLDFLVCKVHGNNPLHHLHNIQSFPCTLGNDPYSSSWPPVADSLPYSSFPTHEATGLDCLHANGYHDYQDTYDCPYSAYDHS